MTWSTAKTWSTGELVTATMLNTEIRDRLNDIWKFTAKGGILVAQSSIVAGQLAVGANNTVLVADSTQTLGVKWATIAADSIASNAVTEAKILNGAVTENKIGTGAVTEGKLGALAVTAGKIGAGAVTQAKLGTDTLQFMLVDLCAHNDTYSTDAIAPYRVYFDKSKLPDGAAVTWLLYAGYNTSAGYVYLWDTASGMLGGTGINVNVVGPSLFTKVVTSDLAASAVDMSMYIYGSGRDICIKNSQLVITW